jgi:hypothetical protein
MPTMGVRRLVNRSLIDFLERPFVGMELPKQFIREDAKHIIAFVTYENRNPPTLTGHHTSGVAG